MQPFNITPSSERGKVTLYACQYDQRFSYYTYIPKTYDKNAPSHLAVIIHGSERAAQSFRSKFIDFAEESNAIILAPLFPSGIIDPNDQDNYKFIKYHDIRFDHVLLAMIDEVAIKYTVNKDRFLLHGFSGGGQFVHRFFYLHPDRLLGVSIGAPGRITYLNASLPWYLGTSDFKNRFGTDIDVKALTRVPVQMVIGGNDTEEYQYDSTEMKDVKKFGNTRVERLQALRDNFKELGISVEFEEVEGVGHEPFKILEPAKKFFNSCLRKTTVRE